MKIINRMILPSILELLLWSTGKVCTCFCITKKKNENFCQCTKSGQKQVPPPISCPLATQEIDRFNPFDS